MLCSCFIMSNCPAVGSRPVANADGGSGVWQRGGRDRSRPYNFAGLSGRGSGNRYRYGGKELTTLKGLNLYDFAARTYAPDLGRFMQPDPSTHDYHWLSPNAINLRFSFETFAKMKI